MGSTGAWVVGPVSEQEAAGRCAHLVPQPTTSARRRAARRRSGPGGDPGFAAGDLLDTPLQVLHHAAATAAGLGASAFTRWY